MRDVRRDYAAYLRVVSSLPSDTQLVTQVSDELYQHAVLVSASYVHHTTNDAFSTQDTG